MAIGPDYPLPRQYTVEETRDAFINHVWMMIDYWDRQVVRTDWTQRERLSGLAHSLLAALDGCAMALPGFVVAPSPHPDDEEFRRSEGENWYPRVESEFDIAGSLHEALYAKGRR